MKNVPITATKDELYAAVAVAAHRRITSIFGRKKEQHFKSEDNSEWSTEIESAIAEMMVARFKNQYWTGSVWDNQISHADVGVNINVRHTHRANGHLIVYKEPEDNPNHRFVLVTGRAPNYVICGWIIGFEAQNESFWNPSLRTPAFFVPQEALRPFSDISNSQP